MTRFIKIFTILTGLTLMTACGASAVLDDLKNVLEQAQAALSAGIKKGLLDERLIDERFAALPEAGQTPEARAEIEAAVAELTLEEIEAALNLSEEELAEIEREAKFKEAVVGLNQEQQDARELACRVDPQIDGCDAVLVNICYDTPFDTACNANPDADRRVEYIAECGVGTNVECIDDAGAACRGDSSITGCGAFVTRVCDADPTYTACDGNADYFLAQDNACWIQGIRGGIRTDRCQQIVETNRVPATAEASCRANYIAGSTENGSNTRCFNAVITVCDLNPFDSFCGHNTNYGNRYVGIINACRTEESDADFCEYAKPFVCDENPFDALCLITDYTPNDYASERQTAINECGQTFVAGDRCEDAAEQFCGSATGEGLFNALCLNDPDTDAGRQPLCVGEKDATTKAVSTRCTTTAMRICDATPLDPLCDGVVSYFSAQLDACVQFPQNPSCLDGAPTQFAAFELIAGCLSTPFDAACLDTTTGQGMLFAPSVEAAQKSYCEGGATTKTATPDHVNCTNIGSLPDYPELANEYEFVTFNYMGNKIENGGFVRDDENVIVQEAKTRKAALGGFLKTGVYGTGLGVYTGKARVVRTHPQPAIPATFDENTGNFDRGNNEGGAWVNLPVDTTEGLPSGYPTTYGIDPNLFTPAPAGTTPADGFIETQNIYEFTSPVDSKDGFIFFLTEIVDERGSLDALPRNVSAYAGILSTSNFGAPLAVRPAVDNANVTAIWAGQFTAHVSDRLRLNAEPTPFYVDFTDRTFNIHNSTENADPKTGSVKAAIGSGAVVDSDIYYEASTFIYTVNGIFGVGVTDPNVSYTNGGVARTLNAGELSGSVTLVNNVFDSKSENDNNNPTTTQTTVMPLTGLIGVEGAVGVFLDPNPSDSGQAGGFTAAPTPAQ